jgi:hypothetical protein
VRVKDAGCLGGDKTIDRPRNVNRGFGVR